MQKGPQPKDINCNVVLVLRNNLSIDPISPPSGTKPLGALRPSQQRHQLPPSNDTADVELKSNCLPFGTLAGRNRNWRRQPRSGAKTPICRASARRFDGAAAPQLLTPPPSKEKAGNTSGRQSLVAVDNQLREEHLHLQLRALQIQRRLPFSDASRHQIDEPHRILPPNLHLSPQRLGERGEEATPARSGPAASLFAKLLPDPPSIACIHHGSQPEAGDGQVQTPLADV